MYSKKRKNRMGAQKHEDDRREAQGVATDHWEKDAPEEEERKRVGALLTTRESSQHRTVNPNYQVFTEYRGKPDSDTHIQLFMQEDELDGSKDKTAEVHYHGALDESGDYVIHTAHQKQGGLHRNLSFASLKEIEKALPKGVRFDKKKIDTEEKRVRKAKKGTKG